MTDNRDLARIEDPESRKMIEDLRHMQRLPKDVKEHELAYFAEVCKRTGLSPFSTPPQVYMVSRWNNDLQRNACAIQTGIDGYRLVSDDRIDGMDPPEFAYDADGKLFSATVRVYRKGCARPFAATAFWSEYVQRRKDGKVTQMWADKPHIMLSKCAEALVRRMAFPMLLSGLYTSEEMMQADREVTAAVQVEPTVQVVQALPPKAPPSLYDKCAEAYAARPVRSEGDDFLACLREAAAAMRVPLPKTDVKGFIAAMTNYATADGFLDAFKAALPTGEAEAQPEPAKAQVSPWEGYTAKGGTGAVAFAAMKLLGKTVRDEADLADAFNAAAEADKAGLVAALKAGKEAIAEAFATAVPVDG